MFKSSKLRTKTAMENRRRVPPEFHPPHWSPVMAGVMLLVLGVIVAVIR